MPSRCWLRGFGGERRLAVACAVLLVAGLAACRGDTLYDAPTTPGNQGNVPPPTVSVTLPTAGAQVLAGRTMRVRAVATDTLGITLLQVDIRGAATGTVVGRFDPPRDTVVLDTTIAIPAGVTGRVEVTATARNSLGGTATTAARSVSVGGIESTAPTVAVTATVPVRMELTDRLHLHITAADNDGGSGIAQLGATVLALSGTKPDTFLLNVPVKSFSPAATGPVTYDVDVAPPAGQALPASLTIQVYAFAVDSSGNDGGACEPVGRARGCRDEIVDRVSHDVSGALRLRETYARGTHHREEN